MTDCKQLLTEASLGRFYQQLVGDDKNESKAIVILTASRASNTSAVNSAMNADLRRILKSYIAPTHKTEFKVGYYKVVGTYAETQADGSSKRVKEDSTVVVIPPVPSMVKKFKDTCMMLGAKFGQDSIFFAEKGLASLIYTRDIAGSDGKIEHHRGEVVPLGAFHPQALGLAFTKIKGKTFAFDWIAEQYVSEDAQIEDPRFSPSQWFETVRNNSVVVFVTPCRPELSNAENHARAEAFEKDLKSAQYGSQIDGRGQFAFDRIGYTQNGSDSELQRDIHVDTFVIYGSESHEDYIRKTVAHIGRRHGCRFALFLRANGEYLMWNFEDHSSQYEESLNGKAGTVSIAQLPIERVFLMGFSKFTGGTFRVEDESVFTNPKSYAEAIPMDSMAKRVKSATVPFQD